MAATLNSILGAMLGVVAKAWLSTLRVTLEVHPDLERSSERGEAPAFAGARGAGEALAA